MDFTNIDDKSAPDAIGLITSLATIGKSICEKKGKKFDVNTDSVDQIAKKDTITYTDFGHEELHTVPCGSSELREREI